MTAMIAGLGVVCLVLFVVATLWFHAAIVPLIPALFVLLFWGTLNAVNYLGYAVDGSHLDGTEAVVLDTIQGENWVYLLVRAGQDTEPRLVRVASNDQSKQGAQAAKERSLQGLTVVRFGQQGGAGQNGDAGDDPGFQIVNLDRSQTFGKDSGGP